MKALSVLQPWASLIAAGAKQIESRSWSTLYRGPLAIAASKGFHVDDRELCEEWPFNEALQAARFATWRDLPCGAIVAVCTLATCRPTRQGTLDLTGWRHWADRFDFDADPEPLEIHFGDYSPGRFGWLLADIKALPEPVPCKGSLGLFNLPSDVVERISIECVGGHAVATLDLS